MRFTRLHLLVLAPAFVTTVAAAQTPSLPTAKPGFQLRVESLGSHTKTGDGDTVDKQTFSVRTARLGLTGDLGDGISYTLRLDMRNALYETSSVGQDNSIAALDRAYIEHRLNENFAVRFGRMPFFALSIENDYSSIDQYFYSYTYDYVAYTLLPINAGLDLTASMGGNAIVFQASNGLQEGKTTENKGNQKGENVNLSLGYRGNLMDGMIKPIVTYSRLSRIRAGAEPNRDEKANYTIYGIGSQFTFGAVDVDLEHDGVNKPAFTSYTYDATKKTTTKVDNVATKYMSYVAQVAYRATELKLRPFVKATSDVVKADSETVMKSSRQGFGVEYRPGPKNFRYHAVMINMVDEDTSGTDSVKKTTQQYILGAAAKI